MRSTLFGLTVLFSAASPVYAAPTCLGPDDDSTYYSQVVTGVLSDTDSLAIGLRYELELPQLTAQEVTLVTDSLTCAKASGAMDASQGITDVNRRMYVFKLGSTRFAVIQPPPSPPAGVFSTAPTLVRYFDSKWNWLSLGEV